MIEKRLKQRFVLISTLVSCIVLFSLTVIMHLGLRYIIDQNMDEVNSIIIENRGTLPESPSFDPIQSPLSYLDVENIRSTRFFYAELDSENKIIEINTSNVSITAQKQVYDIIDNALETGNTEGYVLNYKYTIEEFDTGKQVVFTNASELLFLLNVVTNSMLSISFIVILLVMILSRILAGRAVQPMIDAQIKQKQFITNVSHELKTPLAIIKANTEVIELTESENQWTQSIHTQTEKLNKLVSHLVSLSKYTEQEDLGIKTDFCISDSLQEVIDSFSAITLEVPFHVTITPNLTYRGYEDSIRTLFSTIIENALKYTTSNDDIHITLIKKANKIIFTVTNPADGLVKGNYNHLFERFHREDDSRNSKTPGFGIGLSIVKSIVHNHKGSIHAQSPDGKSLRFTVFL